MATELGHICHLVRTADSSVSPMEKCLNRLGHRLVWLTLALAALVDAAGILQGHHMAAMVQTGVALAIAAVPEGLPVVATHSLARGMWRMAACNAIISNLSSAKTLSATTVILTDKTGTPTENRMQVAGYLVSDIRLDVAQRGDTVQIESGGAVMDPDHDARRNRCQTMTQKGLPVRWPCHSSTA